ncbi:MAG: hypothetical protein J3R72DRAFT_257846 [Linnemannia gamsii]|nr:MAG: hypothetical protein J3R72DRAFT_257846 [Linnemannia gamsii]
MGGFFRSLFLRALSLVLFNEPLHPPHFSIDKRQQQHARLILLSLFFISKYPHSLFQSRGELRQTIAPWLWVSIVVSL